MNKIKILNEDVYSKIAAGEIIERPASVIRELVDNSIDANASEINVIFKNIGLDKIVVVDNGDGIFKDDMNLALTCHATSKITTISDLNKIWTMGFRGEALYAIQNVSKVIITSNTDSSGLLSGYKILNFGEEKFIIENVAFQKGTKVEVFDLFYNIPVRKKFLKSKLTEINQIKKIVADKALANLNIKFKLTNEDKTIFSTDGDNNFKKTFFKIYNDDKFDIFEYNEEINDYLKIKIYYSDIATFFPTRKYIELFVNRRNVNVNFFYAAVDSAIKNYISQGRYPLIYLFITIEPSLIDFNIHPSKKEVKFLNQQEIFLNIKDSINKAFSTLIKNEIISPTISNINFSKYQIEDKGLNFESKINDIKEIKKEERISTSNLEYKIIGVIYDTYIIIEKDNSIFFIDQHAAMEAILYEQKKEEYHIKAKNEKLLIPIILNIERWGEEVENNIKKLNSIGFLIEHSEGTTIIIREVPLILLNKKDYNLIIEIIEEYLTSKNEQKDIVNYLLIQASCKEAIKKGDKLTLDEIFQIVDLFLKYKINNCPHGRPIYFELTKDSLEKIFQRKK